jgi:hypothetical protein
MIGVFLGFSRIFLLGIIIFKGLTARRLYKLFGVKGLIQSNRRLCFNGESYIIFLIYTTGWNSSNLNLKLQPSVNVKGKFLDLVFRHLIFTAAICHTGVDMTYTVNRLFVEG